MAAGQTLTTAGVNQQIYDDAVYMENFYHWIKQRYASWNQNVTSAILQAAPLNFSAGDAGTIMTVVADMNRLITMFEGTASASTENIAGFDLPAVRGCN